MGLEIIYGAHTYGKIGIMGEHRGRIIVGKFCSIASNVSALMVRDHNFNIISTYPFGFPSLSISGLMKNKPLPTTQHYDLKHKMEINIGNDVWLGFGSIIFRDVTIGDGAVIGAFCKVTKNIPPYSIVVGDSRILRKRFSDEDIDFLLKLKWWDLSDQEIADIAPILHNPDVNVLREWRKKK